MDTRDALEKIKNLNALAGKGALNLRDAQIGSLDFTALYPSIPQLDLIEKLRKMIVFGFNLALAQHNTKNEAKLNEVFMLCEPFPSKAEAIWHFGKSTDQLPTGHKLVSQEVLVDYATYVIENAFICFGAAKTVYQIVEGFPTGTNAAPEMANIYLLSYEFEYWQRQLPSWHSLKREHQLFLASYSRYIDDIIAIIGTDFNWKTMVYKTDDHDGIFPELLKTRKGEEIQALEVTGSFGESCNYLDLEVMLSKEGKITYDLYDKKTEMFVNGEKLSEMRTFPHIDTCLPTTTKYGVLGAQMFRFGERSSFGINFMDNVCNQIIKMIRFGYNAKKLLAIVKKFNKWNLSLGRSSRLKWAIIKRIKIWLIRNRRKATGRSRV